ncbi:unnamed protein product [Choristocarpus tenellus]
MSMSDSKTTTDEEAVVADPALDHLSRREIGREGVWSLSSAKPGNGVEQLRDDNKETYWQSDGAQPHLINIQFHKKMSILEVALYLDNTLDESYTPKKVSVRAGSSYHDLVEITVKELNEPMGWVLIPMSAHTSSRTGLGRVDPGESGPGSSILRAHFLQICVATMHQNGRDTHIRQVLLLFCSTWCSKNLPRAVKRAYYCIMSWNHLLLF